MRSVFADIIDFQKVLDSILSTIQKVTGFLEAAEVDDIQRNLRLLVFYPDYILKEFRQILRDEQITDDVHARIRKKLKESMGQVHGALHKLTSDSLVTNLSLSSKLLAQLRTVADEKDGIRRSLEQHIEALPSGKLSASSLRDLRKIEDKILSLNATLSKIDDALMEKKRKKSVKKKSSTKKKKSAS